MHTRYLILGISLIGSVAILFTVLKLANSDLDENKKGDTEAVPRLGPNDPTVVWHTLHRPATHTHRELGFAESFGKYIYVDHTDVGDFPDLLHDCRGNYLEEENQFTLQSPFGDEYILEIFEFEGLRCIVPKGMSLNEALKEGWILTLKEQNKKPNRVPGSD